MPNYSLTICFCLWNQSSEQQHGYYICNSSTLAPQFCSMATSMISPIFILLEVTLEVSSRAGFWAQTAWTPPSLSVSHRSNMHRDTMPRSALYQHAKPVVVTGRILLHTQQSLDQSWYHTNKEQENLGLFSITCWGSITSLIHFLGWFYYFHYMAQNYHS